jgi:hypothetical protein
VLVARPRLQARVARAAGMTAGWALLADAPGGMRQMSRHNSAQSPSRSRHSGLTPSGTCRSQPACEATTMASQPWRRWGEVGDCPDPQAVSAVAIP